MSIAIDVARHVVYQRRLTQGAAMLDGSLEFGVDTLVDDIFPISDRGIPVRAVAPTQPPLRALLASLEIDPIPDDIVTAHKREKVKAADGSDILFALAWFMHHVVSLIGWALLLFSVSVFFVGAIGSIFEKTWGILSLMGVAGGFTFAVLVIVDLMIGDILVRPRARWHEVPYEHFYPYRIPEQVRAHVALLRLNAPMLDDGLDVTILELRQAQVSLDPIAVVSSGDERYAIAIWD